MDFVQNIKMERYLFLDNDSLGVRIPDCEFMKVF